MTLLKQAMDLYSSGLVDQALRVARNGLAVEPQNQTRLCEVAAASAYALGDHAQAERYWTQAISRGPASADTHYNLGILLASTGRDAEAEPCFRRATELNPASANAHFCLGRCLAAANRLDEAERSIRRALNLDPRLAPASLMLGLILFRSGRDAEAEGYLRGAIALDGGMPEAFSCLGDLLFKLGRLREAEDCFRRALALDPTAAVLHYKLGALLSGSGRDEEAESCYRTAITADAGFVPAHTSLGVLLEKRGCDVEAESCYRQAVTTDANFADAFFNLGNLLVRTRRREEAEPCFRRAIELDERDVESLVKLGDLYLATARYAAAESAYRRVHALHPERADVLAMIIHVASYTVSWGGIDADFARLRTLLDESATHCADPFVLLAMPGLTPSDLRRASFKRAQELIAAQSLDKPDSRLTRSGRANSNPIRIGYLSAHLFDHAVAGVLAGVLEAHDRGKVAIHGYSYGPAVPAGSRHRIRDACVQFREVRLLRDADAANLIHADEIDILVDLVGFTRDARPGISGRRPAPVLVNWLGYAGTMGHPQFADYIIGDPVVTPPAHAGDFCEALAIMPHCYLPYDRSREVGPRPDRRAAGLPEGAFVFCSFFQCYKLNREVLDVWCQLMHAVPHSILWLQQPVDEAVAHIRREVGSRGVDPDRLIFAPRVASVSEYLGRLQLADLALDTHPYTSHSVGGDLLWSGVPLVTKIGDTFASRVAASLLHAAGLPELVTENDEAYRALAMKLALEPEYLAAVRGKLAASREVAPLFDTQQFARDLENLYLQIWRHHLGGVRGPVVLSPGYEPN